MGKFLAITILEGSYEYYFTPDTSIGGTEFFNGNPFGRNGNFGIAQNLRANFGYNPKSHIFAEVFGLHYTGQNDLESNLGIRDYDNSATAIGLGLGTKWSAFCEKLTFEPSAGPGRNSNFKEFQNTFMFGIGVSIGFRF
jgi:hypothetical protein